jgi:hypothetical protein
MLFVRYALVLRCAIVVAAGIILGRTCLAQTVWSGPTISFTKNDFANVNLPENQDRITADVWITRNVNGGIFNINQESQYTSGSPVGTLWATGLMEANEGKTIAATNYADLEFTDWVTAYGGTGSLELPARLLTYNAVVRLTGAPGAADDILFDLQFTDWTQGGGGGFMYERATPAIMPPNPTGDYSENGVVDAADYVIWRKTLNEPAVPAGSGADGDADGTVDADDYDYWAARFGNVVPGAGGGSLAAATPEPTSAVLLLLGALCARAMGMKRNRS